MNPSTSPKVGRAIFRAATRVCFPLIVAGSRLCAAPDAAVAVTVASPTVAAGSDVVADVVILNGGDEAFSSGGDSITFTVTVPGLGTNSGSITNGLDIGSSQTQSFLFPSYFNIPAGNVTVTAIITTATRDTNASNHVATTTFDFVVPDLQLDNPTGPATAIAGEDVAVAFGIINNSIAGTDPTKYFPIEANLWTVPPGPVPIERQYLLFKEPVAGNDVHSGLSIPRLRIPATALPGDQYRVELTIDPAPSTIADSNPSNNSGDVFITVGGTSDVQFVPGSFFHEKGTFFSGDPIKMGLHYKNEGDAPVPATSTINIRVALSRDNNGMISQDDFVFRVMNASGNNNGSPLLPGETVSSNWVQTLPEGYQGHFFVLAEIDGVVTSDTNSPSLTIHSRTQPETVHISTAPPTGGTLSDASSVSLDGKWVAYEVLVDGISQIFLKPDDNPPVQITDGIQGSFAPAVSGNGQFVVFHSYAANLVADDFNEMSDVFIYNWALGRITRITKSPDGGDANGGSYYPKVDANGTTVVFESLASNLGEDPNPYFHDIFLYDLTKKRFTAISGKPDGLPDPAPGDPLDSFQADISLDGKRVVFASFAPNLVEGDDNEASDVFLREVDDNQTYRISRILDTYGQIEGNTVAGNGHSSEPAISGDGKYVAFHSVGQNLFSTHGPGRGIVDVKITASGAGYGLPPVVNINEGSPLGTGSGAIAVAQINGVGEVIDINVTNPGSAYLQPIVDIDQAPNDVATLHPDAKAAASAYLSHPDGDLYLVEVDKIIRFENGEADVEGAVQRISERYIGDDPGASVGGNGFSKQPAINYDGKLVAYRTEASNLLTEKITRVDGKTFYSNQSRRAAGRLILGGGITEIEIADSGFGYTDGSLSISDASGSGVGAMADYDVDGNGRIVAIEIIDQGSNYDPDSTEVTVQGTNNSFKAGGIRHTGSVLRVELTDGGLGYPKTTDSKLPDDFTLEINGDGNNALMNHNMIRVGEAGELLLIQKATLALVSVDNLDDATLSLDEYVRSQEGALTITFDDKEVDGWNLATKTIGFTSGPGATSSTELIGYIIDAINSKWPGVQDPMEGLKATVDTTTGSLILEGINGQFSTSDPNSLTILYSSNLLVQGSGYYAGTVSIGPDPVIYGYSEIAQDFTLDDISSDIYLFYRDGMGNVQAGENERVSVSTFGYPVRSFGEPSAPSSRSPALSGDGRFVVFSTDAQGAGGILFDPDSSNQFPTTLPLSRNVVMHDRKISLILDEKAKEFAESGAKPSISLLPELGVLDGVSRNWVEGAAYHVIAKLKDPYEKITKMELLVNNQVEESFLMQDANASDFVFNRAHLSWDFMEQGEHQLLVRGYDDFNNSYVSETQTIYVREKNELHQLPEPVLLQPANSFTLTTTSEIFLNGEVEDEDGYATKMTFYLEGLSFQEAVNQDMVDPAVIAAPQIATDFSLSTTELSVARKITVTTTATTTDDSDKNATIVGEDAFGNAQTETIALPAGSATAVGTKEFLKITSVTLNENPTANVSVGIETLILYPSLDGDQRTSSRWPKPGIQPQIATMQLVVTDNHGNEVMSKPTTVSVVEGTEAGAITLVQPPKNLTVRPVKDAIRVAKAEIQFIQDIPPTFQILAISITDPGMGYVKVPQVVVWGSGSGADIDAVIDTDPFSEKFGQVTELKINNGGRGYLFDNTEVHFIGGHDIEPVLIEANATRPDEVKGVTFVIDGMTVDLNGDQLFNELDSDTTAPYLLNHKFYPGKHDVYVLARDVHNNVFASGVSELDVLTATGVRPRAYIEYPEDMGWSSAGRISQDITTNSNVPVHVRVYDGDGVDPDTGIEDPGSIKEVGLYLDEQRFATLLGPHDRMPGTFIYRFDWHVLGVDRGPYELSAVVIDHDGNYIKSEPRAIEVIASGALKPAIQWISPRTNEEVFSVGSKISLVARTVQIGFPIAAVDFFANGELIQKVTTPLIQMADVSHFAGVWEPETEGDYLLQAVVYDINGSRTATEFRKVLSFSTGGGSLPPEISMMYPAPSQSLTSTSEVRLEATATDVDGSLEGVQFYVNGANGWVQFLDKAETGDKLTLTYDNNDSFTFDFNETTPLPPLSGNTPVLTGNSTKESRDNLLYAMQAKIATEGIPLELSAYEDKTIRLNFETNESIQLLVMHEPQPDDPQRVSLQAQVLDEVDPPAFALDGYPYGMSWTPGLPGTYVLYGVVRDNSGNRVMSSPVAVTSTAGESIPPSVTLLAPADGTTVNVGTRIVLHAVASDKGVDGIGVGDPGYVEPDEGEGLIKELEFFVNGKLEKSTLSQLDAMGRVATAEYIPKEPGVYDFYAVVKDDAGNTVFTPANRVNTFSFQLPQQPGINLVFPTNNFTLTASSKIRLYAALKDPYETMDHVNFSILGGGNDEPEEISLYANPDPGPNEVSYGSDWVPTNPGTYVITAKAIDDDKNVSLVSSPAYVIVGAKEENASKVPEVEFLLPSPGWSGTGQLYPQTQATLLAKVYSEELVQQVDFYKDGVLLGSADTNRTEGLHEYTYQVPAATVAGSTELYAVVRDASGDWNVSTRPALGVNPEYGEAKGIEISKVNPNNLPGVALDFAGTSLTSIGNLSITDNSKLRIYAQASDADGKIVGVQFYVNGSNGWIQFLEKPKENDAVTVARKNSSNTYVFGGDSSAPGHVTWKETDTLEDSRDNLLKALNDDGDIEAVKYETHTILLNFPDFPSDDLLTPDDERLKALVFSTPITSMTGQALPESLLNPHVYRDGHPYAVDWTPGLTGTYVIYAVARDNSKNKVMSAPVSVTATSEADSTPVVELASLSKERLINESLFLSATVTHPGPAEDVTEIQEVRFLVNGVALGVPDDKAPYYSTWTPTKLGHYEVVAYALDNQGNVSFSNVETVDVTAESGATFGFTSLDGTLTGQAKVQVKRKVKRMSQAARRQGTFSNTVTEISGVNTKYMTELVPGQKIIFADGSYFTDVYTVAEILSDDSLTIDEDFSEKDFMLVTAIDATVQIMEVYRSGSWIFLAAGQEKNPAKVARVDFYVDGKLHLSDDTWPFSSSFFPIDTGNYTLIAVAVDNNGVETIVEKRIIVLDQVGELPDGHFALVPQLTREGAVTRASRVVALPKIVDLDDGVNRVEFYLNGKLHSVDYFPPFYCIFSPDSDAPIILTDRIWELTMVAVDNSGNRISLTQGGTLAGSVQLPVAVMTHPVSGAELTAGQVVNITIEVTGLNLQKLVGPNAAAGAGQGTRKMALFANGEEIGEAKETSFGTGEFSFEWSIKSELAGSDGKVDIFGAIVMEDITVSGLTFTPSIVSDPVTITLTERNPLGDAESAISQFYKDLLFYEPAEEEVNLALEGVGHGTPGEYAFDDPNLFQWAARLAERQAFQNLVDAVSGHNITIGDWPTQRKMMDALQTYSAIPNYGTDGSGDNDGDGYSSNQETLFGTSDNNVTLFPDNAFRLGSYLDNIYSSLTYLRRHGGIKPLSGTSQLANYEENRREFVTLLFGNKYGNEPTLQNQIQGSYRIQVLDPQSQAAKKQNQQQMMQQMMMMSMFGGGFGNNQGRGNQGNQGNNNNLIGQLFGGLFGNNNNQAQAAPKYKNGDGAVNFTAYMVLEEQIDNMDLLWNAQGKRDIYQTAALMLALWQENIERLDEDEIMKYSSMPLADRIQAMMKDYRYFSRFPVSISADAQTHSDAPEWKYLPWLGDYNDRGFPWIYHQGLGWVYVQAPDTTDIWLYIPGIGWMWTKDTLLTKLPTYEPAENEIWTLAPLYDATSGKWMYYVPDHPTSGRKFYDFDQAEFVER